MIFFFFDSYCGFIVIFEIHILHIIFFYFLYFSWTLSFKTSFIASFYFTSFYCFPLQFWEAWRKRSYWTRSDWSSILGSGAPFWVQREHKMELKIYDFFNQNLLPSRAEVLPPKTEVLPPRGRRFYLPKRRFYLPGRR